jgi:hypothetical protein
MERGVLIWLSNILAIIYAITGTAVNDLIDRWRLGEGRGGSVMTLRVGSR